MRFDMALHPWGDFPWNFKGKWPVDHGPPKIPCNCRVRGKNHFKEPHPIPVEFDKMEWIQCSTEKFMNSDGLEEHIYLGKCPTCDRVYWYEIERRKKPTVRKSK